MNYLLQRAASFKKEQAIQPEQKEQVATSSEVFEKNQSAIAQSAAESFQRKQEQRRQERKPWAQEMVEQEQHEQQERNEQERKQRLAQSFDRQRSLPRYLTGGVPEKTTDTRPRYLTGGAETSLPDSIRQAEAEEPKKAQQNNPFIDGQIPERQRSTSFADIIANPWLAKQGSGAPTTEQMLEYAQAQLENYRQTDAYKARAEEKWRENLPAYLTGNETNAQPISPATGLPEGEEKVVSNSVDLKEKELQATVDYWKNVQRQEKEEKTTADNLAIIASWPEEDQQALNDYVKYRFQETLDMGDTNLLRYVVHMVQSKDQREATERLREKYGEEVVEQLAETLDRVNAAEEVQELQEAGARHGESHPVLSSLAAIPADVISGITSLPGFAHNLTTRTGQYETLNPNNPGDFSQYGGAVQGQVASKIEDTWAGEAGSYLYRGAMSAAESGLRAATGKAGTVVLSGLSSFTQTVSKASAQGATPLKAVALGGVNATIEALSEEIPLDNLLQNAAEGPQAIQQVLKAAFIQGGIEASTEEISLIGTTLAEAAILQKQGGYAQQVQKAVAEGADYTTACAEAMSDLLSEAADTAVVSFISGVGMSAANSLITNHDYKKAAKAQSTTQDTDTATDTVPDTTPDAATSPDPATTPEATPEVAPEAESLPIDNPVADTAPIQQPEVTPAAENTAEQVTAPESQPRQTTTQQVQASDLDTEIDNWDWDSGRSFMNAHPDIAKDVSDYAYELLTDLQEQKHTFGVDWGKTEEVGIFHDQYGMSAKQIESALNAMAYGTALENDPQSAKIEAYILERLAASQRTYVQTTESTPQQPQTFAPQSEEYISQPAAPTPEQRLTAAIEETLNPSPVTKEQIQSVDTQATETYNKNRRSQTVQDTIDRLNAGGDTSPNINEIMSIPEIAEAERANEDTPTIDRPNREQIRENGYQQAMQRGSWNGTDYSGEVNHDKRMDIVIGLPGSGKSSVYTERLSQEYKSRVIDTDDFREYIPEYNGSNASVVHEEASAIRDMVFDTALDNGDNILLSTIGANAKKLETQIAEFVADGYQVYLHLNELPNNKSMARAIGRYVGEDGSLGRYVSPKLIAEYGDKPTQAYLYLTDQGGNENGRLDSNLRAGGGQNVGDAAQTGRAPENSTDRKGLLAGYDWYNNDVARGEAPRLIQTSEQTTSQNTPQTGTPKASEEGGQPVPGDVDTATPGIKGTGAAEANFTGKADYYDLLSNENSQPDRATDVRPMKLPKTDVNGNPVSEVTGNAYASKITPDGFASLMEEPTAKGDFSYVKITNDQATKMAMESISYAGDWDSAYSQWSKDVGAGKTGAEMAARGALLLNHFAQEGNKTQWLNTLADMQDLGTNTAQGLQAFRILRDLNVQDKAAFMEMVTKRLGQKMGIAFDVDQSLYDAYNNATTDEARNTAIENIEQAVAEQIPSTLLEKWNALRYTNMLGNLKTNVRNVAGNVGAGAMYRVKDQVAASMEDVLYVATGGKFERTKSHTVSKEQVAACAQDFDMVANIVSDGGKFGTQSGTYDQFTQGVMDKRRIFKSDNKILNAIYAPMEGYRKVTNWAMNNGYFGDEAFGRAAYARSLAGYLKAHDITDTDLSKVDTGLMDKARAYAVKEAQEATFHDNSALANIAGKVKRATGVVGEGIMPFTKTPANVLTRAEEFSPLGIINTAVDAAKAAKGGGDVTGVEVVNSLSKSLTGTAIFALGAWLKNQGFLTGGPDDDDDKDDFDKLNGDQNYALRFTIGGKTYNYTMDWLTPAAMPLFMGAQFMDILNNGFENLTYADLENVFTGIADPMLQMSMLQSLNDSLDNIKYSDNNLGQFFINAAVSYLTQGLGNTLLGQIERSTEKNRMTTYVDKESAVPAWAQRQLGSLSQKIPGWGYHQTEYINARGETEKNEGGNGFGRLIYNLLSPGYISAERSDALTEELHRLNEAGVDGNVFPEIPSTQFSYTDQSGIAHKDYNLTTEEADILKRVTGKTSDTLLADLIETDTYQSMNDQQKADAVNLVKDYAREKGRSAALDGYSGMDAWMKNLDGNEAETILNKVVQSSFSDAFTTLSDSWNYGTSTDEAVQALDQVYSVYSGMNEEAQAAFMKDNGGRTSYFLKAKEAQISTADFAEMYKQYKQISDNDDLETGEKANQWAYTLQKAQSSGALTEEQKNVLKDSMVFRFSTPAEATKFNEMTSMGISEDTALKVEQLMDGIVGTGALDEETGEAKVTTADKYGAIASSGLSEEDIDTIMLAYMPDYDPEASSVNRTELKYRYAREEMGKSAQWYADAYQIYGEYSKKSEITSAWQQQGLASSQEEANNIYYLFSGNTKKIDLDAWYAANS